MSEAESIPDEDDRLNVADCDAKHQAEIMAHCDGRWEKFLFDARRKPGRLFITCVDTADAGLLRIRFSS